MYDVFVNDSCTSRISVSLLSLLTAAVIATSGASTLLCCWEGSINIGRIVLKRSPRSTDVLTEIGPASESSSKLSVGASYTPALIV